MKIKAWEEGEFIDKWSAIHFMTGVLSGFAPYFFNITFAQAIIVFSILIVYWEITEVFKKVSEKFTNQISDILIGLVGFISLFYFVQFYVEGLLKQIGLFIFLFILTIYVSFLGWRSYKKNRNYC